MAVLAAAPAAAVDYVWNNASGGNWNTPTNWTPNGVPSSNADTATITEPGTYTVTVDGGFFVKTVTLGGASGTQTLAIPATRQLVLSANIGTATMTVNANGVLALGGQLAGVGSPVAQVTINGRWDWAAGTVTSGVATTIGPAATLAASGSLAKTLTGGGTALTNNGTITLAGSENLYVENNAVLTNAASGLVDLQANVGIVQTGGGTSTLNNAGLLRKSGGTGTSTILLIAINNTGTIDAQLGTLTVTQPFASGAVQSSGAGNALNAQAGAALAINAVSSATFAGTTFGGAGAKSIGSGSVPHTYSGTIAASNTTIVGGEHRGTFTINGDLAFIAGTLGNGVLNMTIPAGATFTVTGSGTKQFVGAGSLVGITNSGTLRFNATNPLQGNNQSLIQNTAGGLIEFLAQGGLSWQASVSPAVLVNAGTVRFASGTTVPITNWQITNTGTISLQSGLFAWSPTTANFSQTAGRLELVGGNMSNQRHLSISGGVLAGNGSIQGPDAVNVGGGPAQTRPGTSPGQLTFVGNLVQTGTYFVELNGVTPGTQYDQLVAQGTVTVGGTLTVTLGFVPPVGTVFRIIDKTSAGPVTGAFSGMPQGHTFTVNGVQLQISYAGGDGNDVTLTVTQNSGLICTPFTDVDQANPLCPNVQWMKNRGVTIGCTTTLYCPADATTRLQMAVFMNRLGNVLSGTPQVLAFPSVSLTGAATEVICQAPDQAATNYERQVTLDAVLMGLGGGNAEYTVEPVTSVDGGTNWIALAPAVPFSTFNGRWANVRVSGDREVAPTEVVRYGLRLVRTAGVGFTEARCALRLVTGNRVTGTPP
ncbi:MAG: hypothetical protein OEX23_14000 [Betaproteobacteria bacterium]|nr:hypothetical protein [Betaproteobacteria bacterium]